MEILNTIVENKKALIEGRINSIPLPFSASKRYFSGIFPGALVCLTAETSVGEFLPSILVTNWIITSQNR